MAFIDQVQDLTSLSASDTDELSQFLKDGVIDVTSRWLAIRPQDIDLFIRVSGEQTANDSLALNGVKIINVVREDGTNNQWRNCRKISPALQYDVTDVDSLNYASKINPAYTLLHNGKVNVFPSAAVGGANSFKVYYVNNEPTDLTNNAALIHSHSDIQYFPADKVYLVSLYASIKTVAAVMGGNIISISAVPPDVPSLSTVSFSETNALNITASEPGTPSDPSFSVTAITEDTVSAGSVASVTVGTDTAVGTVALTGPSIHDNTVPSYADQSLRTAVVSFNTFYEDTSNSNPFGTSSDPGSTVVTAVPPDSIADTIDDFSLAGEFDDAMAKAKALIDTATIGGDTEPESAQYWLNNEDIEMVGATIQVASQELQRANLGLQDALQTFNTDMQKFQASGIGKSNADVAVYQSEVNAQVQEYTQKLQRYQAELNTVYQAWAKTESDNLQLFQIEIQNEQNNFNEANAVYQAALQEEAQNLQVAAGRVQQQAQIEIQEVMKQADVDMTDAQKEADLNLQASIQNTANDLKAKIENNAKTLEKDIQEYAQELTLFNGEIQKYQAQVNKEVQEYTSQLQGDIQQIQADIASNQNLLTKYQAEIAEYQAEVAAETQEQTTKMQQYQLLYTQLKAEYDQAFMIAAPQQAEG